MTVTLQDHSRFFVTGQATAGVEVKIFLSQDKMPTITALGDIMLLRRVKRMSFGGNYFLRDTWDTEIILFSVDKVPHPDFKEAYADAPLHYSAVPTRARANAAEQYYVIELRNWASGIKELPTLSTEKFMKPVPTGPARGLKHAATANQFDKKFSLLQDIKDGTFVDLVGEVRKLWGTKNGTNLYLTDYTSNNLLFDYKSNEGQAAGQDGDEHGYLSNMPTKGWGGPFGKMTIQVTLWAPHDSYANADVHIGDIVLLRNVHVSFKYKYLEGVLHQDRRNPEQIDIRKLNSSDPRIQAMMQRRDQYSATMNGQGNDNKAKLAKAQKKKKRKENKKLALAGTQEGDTPMPDPESNDADVLAFVPKTKINANSKYGLHPAKFKSANQAPTVVAGNEHQPFLTISEFVNTPHLKVRHESGNEMTLDFVNQKVRTRIRVVDYKPSNLEDFASSLDDASYNDSMEHSYLHDRMKWEWAFYLLVEDAKPPPGEKAIQLPLVVFGDDAVDLLKLDPVK
jgi:protection of telomeres protein 1